MTHETDIYEDSLPSETYFIEFRQQEQLCKPLKLPQLYEETRSTFHTTASRNRNIGTPDLPPATAYSNKNELLEVKKAGETNRCLGKPKQINRTLNLIYKRAKVQAPSRQQFQQENQHFLPGSNRTQWIERGIPKKIIDKGRDGLFMDEVVQQEQLGRSPNSEWSHAQRTILSLKALLN